MSHTLTLTFATLGELQTAVAKLAGEAAPAKAPAAAPKAAPAASPSSAATETPAAAPAQSAASVEFPALEAALRAYAKKVDRETFGATMKKFGCANMKDVQAKPEVWADLLKVANG